MGEGSADESLASLRVIICSATEFFDGLECLVGGCDGVDMCCIIVGLLRMVSSLSICAASEMVDIGVLNSWVMLLMKSFFISDSFFWRNAITMVHRNTTSSTNVNPNDGIMNRTDENMYLSRSGK